MEANRDFFNQFLCEKEYLLTKCLNELKIPMDRVEELYEIGVITLYRVFIPFRKMYKEISDFDVLTYDFLFKTLKNYCL